MKWKQTYVTQEAHPMERAYTTKTAESNQWFAEADEQYAAIKRQLLAEEHAQASHTVLEELLDTQGRELLRLLFQGQLRSRSGAEPVEPVVGQDGAERTHRRRGTSRELMSIFGPVRVERLGMSGREAGSLFVLDAELNLPEEDYSLGVRKRAAAAAAQNSFEQARSTLAASTGADVPKRQLQQIVTRAARDFEAYYEATSVWQRPEETGKLLIQTFDSTGITMHLEDRVRLFWYDDPDLEKSTTSLISGRQRNEQELSI